MIRLPGGQWPGRRRNLARGKFPGEAMRKIAQGLLLAGIFAGSSGWAAAEESEWAFSGRVGPTVGSYEGDVKLKISDLVNDTQEDFSVNGDQELAYGLQGGLTAGYGRFFGDLAVEYLRLDFQKNELDRTDVLVSLGSKVGTYGSLYVGYRSGMQGDGLFNDDTFKESGPFIGAGLGGIPAGALILGGSVAYNFSKVDDFPVDGQKLDYEGVSIKFSAALASMPQHSLQLRFQNFNGDDSISEDLDDDGNDDLKVDFELEESYLQLYYIYSFSM
jgi:hypothetical protein